MIFEQVTRRVESSAVLSEIQSLLLQLIAEDAPASGCTPQWDDLIPTLYQLLGGTDRTVIQPFAAAWATLTAAMRRLDHLQDGDLPDHALPTGPQVGSHYNLLLSYYLLAMALLDDLDDHAIPAPRLLRLRRL